MKHTSKLIIGSSSKLLDGKSIALCITGSVAAVETVALSRLLMRHGAEVYVVMSAASQKIVHPHLLEWATGNPVITELTGQIEHITLAGKHDEHVDLVMVAPSTANTVSKIACGIDDTPVTTTVSSAIGASIPVFIVPAMHESMYDHPSVKDNISKLVKIGVHVMEPRMEEAKAKIPTPEVIVEEVLGILGPKDMVGRHFVITAGPTRGWFDRVRFITNPATGKMGIALSKELLGRGANVTLILGPTSEKAPHTADVIPVETTHEMFSKVMETLESKDLTAFISTAAVLDYEPEEKEDRKRPSGKAYSVDLVPTPKIIEEVRKKYKTLPVIGFKVESGVSDEELEERARAKIKNGICNLVIANDASRKGVAFGTDTNEVLIVGENEYLKHVPLSPKREIARAIADSIAELLK